MHLFVAASPGFGWTTRDVGVGGRRLVPAQPGGQPPVLLKPTAVTMGAQGVVIVVGGAEDPTTYRGPAVPPGSGTGATGRSSTPCTARRRVQRAFRRTVLISSNQNSPAGRSVDCLIIIMILYGIPRVR